LFERINVIADEMPEREFGLFSRKWWWLALWSDDRSLWLALAMTTVVSISRAGRCRLA
jgi:hypothetical protein